MARNPFRSESSAFGLVLLTVVAFAAVALAAVTGGTWPALAVWVIVTAAAAAFYLRRGRPLRVLRTAPAHVGPAGERRLLLFTTEALRNGDLAGIGQRADRVLVVSPAAPSVVQRWVSDIDGPRARADARVGATVETLRSLNIDAAGAAGDGEPLQAIEDALRTFGGDEIVVATAAGPRGDALVASIRRRFALPVTQLSSGRALGGARR